LSHPVPTKKYKIKLPEVSGANKVSKSSSATLPNN
jgi:hypothetical protein